MSQYFDNIKRSTKSVFLLLSLLLAVLIGLELQQSVKRSSFITLQLEGANTLSKMNALVLAMGEARGLCAAYLAGDSEFQEKCQSRQKRVDELLRGITEGELKTFRAEGDYRRMMSLWNMTFQGRAQQQYSELFDELTRTIEVALSINEKIYAFSNLKLDEDILSHNYSSLYADVIPTLQESLGQIRGIGTSLIVSGASSNREQLTLVGEQSFINHQIETLLKIRQELTLIAATPEDVVLSLVNSIEQTQSFININVKVLSNQNRLSSEGADLFFIAGTQPILQLQSSADIIYNELIAIIENRQVRNYAMLIFLCVSIVVLSALLIFIYRRTHSAIDAMQASELRYQEANDAKTQFLSNMSHELRTPLNGIYGVLQILEGEKEQPKHLQKLTRIALESTEMLTLLIGNILDLAKIEQREIKLENEPFMINEMLETYLPTFKSLADQNDTNFVFRIDPICHMYWSGDKLRIMQIINNVVGNAIKFSPKEHVSFEASSPGGILRLDVRDTGIGMDEDTLETLYQRFRQASDGNQSGFQGSGLGMAICKELIDLMDGTIEVHSELGLGTEIIIELPLQQIAAPVQPEVAILEAMAALSDEDSHEAKDWRESHVLLVDDAMNNLFVLEAMLASMVKEVSIASSGFEALEIINHTHVDILVSDISMPGMDGMQLLKRIRAYQPFIPAVALSGNVLKEDILAYRKAGFDEVLSKPVQKRDLQAAIEKSFILRKAEQDGDLPASDNLTVH